MLFAIIGCGNNTTNKPNSSAVSRGATTVSLSIDKKKQHTIYANKQTNLTINHIILARSHPSSVGMHTRVTTTQSTS